MNISTNRTTQDEVYQVALNGTAAVDCLMVNQGAKIVEVCITNYGAAVAHFRTDGKAATASDRVLMSNERIYIARSAVNIRLYSAVATSIEVCFSA